MIIDIENKLKVKDINPTAMRLLVLEFLTRQNAAISLNDLERGMAPSDRITLYRTLKTFEEKGLVHSIEDGTGATKYALCEEDCDGENHHDLHVHFYCNTCKETFCLPNTKIPDISLPINFFRQEMNLIIKGICDQCNPSIPLQ
ncbi:Fur family transcriptional regulator [Pedobacter panaciterrae]|jgi:Fe2+/Zn2+ uptake regulation proteins|uniref:Transcriptional repressor n=1 Tax=Pedobacter panaciterrae TaxID=363849 RepID=A0ABU8NK29_9SPHI|nr:transcriptional repressor [Pedobacter panaciterrae]NQX53874.1 transcriptional repressor [Pedobacter panaciterrae]